MESIIEIKALVKRYDDFVAVNGISFAVKRGDIFGILGPNGAGKTTTLEMIEGLKKITAGTVMVDGHDVDKETALVKSLIGVQLQASSFFDGLNLAEIIDTFAAFYNRKVDAMALLRDVQLEEKAKSMVKELSGGQKQRLSIAAALVNDPKVVFLDEPTTGLDPQARRNLWELVRQIRDRGTTVVLTTHYMEEAEVLCDRIAVMDKGKIVAIGTKEELIEQAEARFKISFAITNGTFEMNDLSKQLKAEVCKVEEDFEITTSTPEETLPTLFAIARDQKFFISKLELHRPTLEDVFLKFTGHALRD